jgi:hypothetical protein
LAGKWAVHLAERSVAWTVVCWADYLVELLAGHSAETMVVPLVLMMVVPKAERSAAQ